MYISTAVIFFAYILLISPYAAHLGRSAGVYAAVTLASPVVVSASQFFEGHDGAWSSFELRVGSPAQNLRVLPGTSSTTTIVVLPQGCSDQTADCANNRGGIFNLTASSTWESIGIYGLGFENSLGYTDNGQFGFDMVGLGYQGSGGPIVNHSVIAGVAGTEFFIGMLGVNPRPTNFTDLNDPKTSFLSLMRQQSHIPSLSYSYTAGAKYRPRTVLGSLVLGGYDNSRSSNSSSISVPFFSDQTRDLTVGLQSISTNATSSQTTLLSSGIYTSIDSSVAELWLPLSVCQAFEEAFGLSYNTTSDLYLVNDTLHSKLLATNPSVSMILGGSTSGGSTINITFPYASFDLEAQYPLVPSGSSRYFPLKRAANESQYTLGRTFLQEAHIIVDYERQNFTVRPCVWTSDPEYILSIPSINATNTSTNNGGPATTGGSDTISQSLSKGAIAGIVVGALVIVGATLGGLYYFVFYKPRRAQGKTSELADTAIRPSSKNRAEVGEGLKPELQSKFEGPEMEGTSSVLGRAELPQDRAAAEMEALQIFEMQGSDVPELDSGLHGQSPPRDVKRPFSFEENVSNSETKHSGNEKG